MATLLSLPAELLQRIAGYLPCSAALQLTLVNRELHTACYDRLVFKNIALNSAYHSDVPLKLASLSAYRQESLDWADGGEYLANATFEGTARTAYAVEQLLKAALRTQGNQWSSSTAATGDGCPPDLAEWLPHLLALRHPACQLIRTEPLLQTYYELGEKFRSFTLHNRAVYADGGLDSPEGTDLVTAAFPLTYILLLQLGNSFLYSGKVNPNTTEVRKFLANTISSVDIVDSGPGKNDAEFRNIIGHTIEKLLALDPDFGTFPLIITLEHAYTWIIPLLLGITLRGSDRPDQFPYPAHIAFISFMNIPHMYQNTAALFNTCHIDKMTTPEALSGTWIGYYSDHRGEIHIDPPMWYIHMRARPRGPNDRPSPRIKAILDRSTNGADSHGAFTFYGEVFDDGKVDFAKLYTTKRWTWMYRGIVTPFGIVGAWGSFGYSFGGHFWIWNKNWR